MSKLIKTSKDWKQEIAAREAAAEEHWKTKLDAVEATRKAEEKMHLDVEERMREQIESLNGQLDDAEANESANRQALDGARVALYALKNELVRLHQLKDDVLQLVESQGRLVGALRALSPGDLALPILDAVDASLDAADEHLGAFEEVPGECFAAIDYAIATVQDTISVQSDASFSDFDDEPTREVIIDADFAEEGELIGETQTERDFFGE